MGLVGACSPSVSGQPPGGLLVTILACVVLRTIESVVFLRHGCPAQSAEQ